MSNNQKVSYSKMSSYSEELYVRVCRGMNLTSLADGEFQGWSSNGLQASSKAIYIRNICMVASCDDLMVHSNTVRKSLK